MNPLSYLDALERALFGDASFEWTEYRELPGAPDLDEAMIAVDRQSSLH